MIQVVSVLYAGATLSQQECLEIPERGEIPITGTAPVEPESPKEPSEKVEKTNKIIKGLKMRIAKMFSNPDDADDSELME